MRQLSSVLFICISLTLISVLPVSAALLAPEGSEVPVQGSTETVEYAEVKASLEKVQAEHSATLAQSDPFGLEATAGAAELTTVGEKDLAKRIGQVLYAALGFVGVIFLVVTIYGGFLWMTAGGNTQKVSDGRDYIKNGAIGIVIILSSYAITFFVLNLVTGTT